MEQQQQARNKTSTQKAIKDKTETKQPIKDKTETKQPMKDKTETKQPIKDKTETKQLIKDKTETKQPIKDKNSMVIRGVTFYKAEEGSYKEEEEEERGRGKNSKYKAEVSKLFLKWFMWLQVVIPTKQEYTRLDSLNQLISIFRQSNHVMSRLAGTKTFWHTALYGIVWTNLLC